MVTITLTEERAIPISVKGGQTLLFDLKHLRNILCSPEVVGKRVVVLSVTGDHRLSKAFVLKYTLRYLRARGADNWHCGSEGESLRFDWAGGFPQYTKGVWAWNKLFPITWIDDEEILVMLLDTQHINLMVRDWESSHQYPFQDAGGGPYRRAMFSNTEPHYMERRLQRFYQTSYTYLLPPIVQGPVCMNECANHRMDEEFHIKHYKESIEKCFYEENLKPKRLFDLDFTCGDLFKYCEHINQIVIEKGGFDGMSILEADLRYYYTRKRENYADDYRNAMEMGLKQLHEEQGLENLDDLNAELQAGFSLKLAKLNMSAGLQSIERDKLFEELKFTYVFIRKDGEDVIAKKARKEDALLFGRVFHEFEQQIEQARDGAIHKLQAGLKSAGSFCDDLKDLMELKIAAYGNRIHVELEYDGTFYDIWKDRNNRKIDKVEKFSPRTLPNAYDVEPSEFCDSLTYNLMTDPVMLPQSLVVIDRSTIVRHLSEHGTDPFNRMPLRVQELVPLPILKKRIQTWKSERLNHNLGQLRVN